jgi:ABC-type transport system involved in multi-copper enzyme maturation permease subunit
MEKFVNQVVSSAKTNASIPVPDFSLYSFPYVWQNLAFLGGFFKIFIALIVVIFVTNEYSYKTIRQNVMNGLSREQFLASKVLFSFLLSFSASFVLFFSGLALGLTHTEELDFALVVSKMGFIAAYFLELFTFSLLAMFTGFLLQRSGLAIGLLAVYYYIGENILGFMLPDKIAQYLPVESMGNLIDVPNSALMRMFGVNFSETVSLPDVMICSIWSLLFVGMTWLMLRNRDF